MSNEPVEWPVQEADVAFKRDSDRSIVRFGEAMEFVELTAPHDEKNDVHVRWQYKPSPPFASFDTDIWEKQD